MLTVTLIAASLVGQLAGPPRIVHPSGKRDGLTITETITCPLSGDFKLRLGSNSFRHTYALSLTHNKRSFSKAIMREFDHWLSEVGYLEYLEIGCTDDAAIVSVHSTKIENGKGGSQSFAFLIKTDGLVRTPPQRSAMSSVQTQAAE